MRSVGNELFHADGRADGRADGQEEANSRFRNFMQATKNILHIWIHISRFALWFRQNLNKRSLQPQEKVVFLFKPPTDWHILNKTNKRNKRVHFNSRTAEKTYYSSLETFQCGNYEL
jgi:hypothetical protein